MTKNMMLAAAVILASGATAFAQVDFNEVEITHFATSPEIQALANKTSVGTLYVRSNGTDTVYLMHSAAGGDDNFEETLISFDAQLATTNGIGVLLADNATMMADSNSTPPDDLRPSGVAAFEDTYVFINGLGNNREAFVGDLSVSPIAFTSVTGSLETLLNGNNGVAFANATQIVAVNASDFGGGNGDTVLIDLTAGTITTLFPAADIQAVTGESDNSIRGFDVENGTLWGFENTSGSILRIDDVLEPTRTITEVTFPGIGSTSSVRNIVVSGDVLLLNDNANDVILAYDISDSDNPVVLATVEFSDIEAAIPGTTFGEPNFHSGMAVTRTTSETLELFIGARNSTGLGLIKVTFGQETVTSAQNWDLY
ncbi:MAG: hypothetical protein JJU11_16905 [Candidatus Sumerlaeia bacterium]|nr:hypothetical protein [Candidatus Sumerlaeia bacterium]